MSQRFTDAELAAEYWRAMASSQVSINLANRPMTTNEDHQRLMRDAIGEANIAGVLLRFATLPHAHDPEPRTVYVYDPHGLCIGSFAEPWPREETKETNLDITPTEDTK